MARSSRHKSGRHREGREYSDSERESRRSGKESGSGEKRGKEYVEEYGSSSSKKRRGEDEAGGSRKSGSSSGRRREESSGGVGKGKETVVVVDKRGKGDRGSVDRDGDRVEKKGFVDNEPSRLDNLQSPEADNQAGRRNKKKRDGYDNVDKHQEEEIDNSDRRMSSRETRQKDERHKEEKYKEKYREDVGRGVRHGDDKQRDENAGTDYPSRRYDEKLTRDDYEALDVRQRDRGRGRDRDREYALERDHQRDAEFYHDRERDRVRDRSRSRDYDRVHDNDNDYDWEWEQDRDIDRDNDRKADRNRDTERDHDGSHLDDKSTRYKDRRGKKRSPDDRDDFDDNAPGRSRYTDRDKRLMKSGRVEPDAERGRSQLRQAHVETAMTGNRRRNSPITDEHRHFNSEDMRYRDSILEHRQKSRDTSGHYGASERGSRYRSMEKSVKMDDGRLGELASERSILKGSSSMGLVERSPSVSAERRYMNRTGVRHSLDEETMKRGGAFDGRDYSANDDRFIRDLAPEKPSVDESSQDLAFYGRTSQGHPSLNAQPSVFRAGVDSPRGSLDEDSRANNSTRYRRSSDPNVGRGPGNAWRGVPNWPSPAPNGFIPFQHGPPPHGGFQSMIPQFPPPPIFGVRPSVDVSHSGFPYHLSDPERFPAHMRPLGWQNMMDGSGPPHMHGWEGNNGMFRDEGHMYGGLEWEQNRQPVNGRGWEPGADVWKGQTDETNREFSSTYQKDVTAVGPQVDSSLGQAISKSEHDLSQAVEPKSIASPVKEPPEVCLQGSGDRNSHLSKPSSLEDAGHYSRVYLSMLDISKELADPELYDNCIDLVDTEQSTDSYKEPDEMVDEDVILTEEKTSSSLTNHSHSITIKDNVFQRALELYKSSVGPSVVISKKLSALDISSAPNNCNLEERVAGPDAEKVEEPLISYEDDMPVSHVPTTDIEAVSDGTLQNKEQFIEEDLQPNPEGIKEDGILLAHKKQSMLTPDDEDIGGACETKCNPSACGGEGKQDNNGETMSALLYSDGSSKALESLIPESNESESSKACEAMMPVSNESESVILHRIHHSPESTH